MATLATRMVESRSTAKPLFVATIFVSSFLLFLMQPMIARMALPRLGGAPSVWNSAMLVYQLLLLGGYAYAHVIGRLGNRTQLAIHLALLALASAWLPLGLIQETMPADASPIIWVPWLLIGSIAPLFLAVSAQAPLLQRWLSLRDPGANPYALYVASNLGSFGGLLAYPLLLEPVMPIAGQSIFWSVGYVVLVALIAVCGLLLPKVPHHRAAEAADVPSPTLARRLHWIALAAVPSGLILSTTLHLTTDIIAMPLIWVIPLGLYLLSFTFAFSQHSKVAEATTWAFPLILIVAGAMAGSGQFFSLWASIAADLVLLFAAAVTLHHQLYKLRPHPSQLTDFYLCTSIGGVIGGIFCALIAPAIFDWLYEYPILVVAAALLMPLRENAKQLTARQRRWVVLAALLLSLFAGGLLTESPGTPLKAITLVLIAMLARFALAHRVVFATVIATLLMGLGGWTSVMMSLNHDTRTRSYFGIYTIGKSDDAKVLIHGTTTHGTQLLTKGLETYPTSYYAPKSGVGIAMQAAPTILGAGARIGVVGLGAGTLACYAQPGQAWQFYEIDPAIVKIASNPKHFTFLSRCLPRAKVVIGDARLSLTDAETGSLDLLVIDAFSSDSIPMHLLTTEAISNYRRVLSPDGLLLFHISNRYIDLKPVLGAAAREAGWSAAVRDYSPDLSEAKYRVGHSIWIAFARSPSSLRRLTQYDPTLSWTALKADPEFRPWTDDYGSILPLLRKP